MKPCPNCGWMLKESDHKCSMCGQALAGAAPPPPAASSAGYAPPPPVQSSGGYPAPPPQAAPTGGGGASPWAQAPSPQVQPTPYAAAPQAQLGAGQPGPPQAAQAAVMPAQAVPPPSPAFGVAAMQRPSAVAQPHAAMPPPVPPRGVHAPAMPPPVPNPHVPGVVPVPPQAIPSPVAVPGQVAPLPVVPLPAHAPQPPMVMPAQVNPMLHTADDINAPQPIQSASGAPVLIGFLVTFQNEPTGKFWPLRSGRIVLGRAGVEHEADVALQDASASARHAVIHGDPATGQAFVEDVGSRNGTFVNESKLDKGMQRQLHDNDRLRLGSITLVVKLLASG